MRGKPIQKSRIQEVKNSRRTNNLAPSSASPHSWLLGSLASWLLSMSLLPAFADAAPGGTNVSGASAPSVFVAVSRLGESEQQAAARDGQLMSHRRATDPFGITIRGAFTGIPPVAEHSPATPAAQPAAVNQIAAAVNAPTLEKAVHVPTFEQAVQELAISAVNLGSPQILIQS